MSIARNSSLAQIVSCALVVTSMLASCRDELPGAPGVPLDHPNAPISTLYFSEFIFDSLSARLLALDSGKFVRELVTDGQLSSQPGRTRMVVAVNDIFSGELITCDLDGRNIVNVPIVTGGQQILPETAAISPDGTKVAVVVQDLNARSTSLVIISDATTITIPAEAATDCTPVFSPDNNYIAYYTRGLFGGATGGFAIAHTSGDSIPVQVVNNMAVPQNFLTSIEWNKQNGRVLFHSASNLFTCDQNGSSIEVIAEGIFGSWSPDGERIVFTTGDFASGKADLAVAHLRQDRMFRIENLEPTDWVMETLPRWSPDGNWISYTGFYESNFGFSRPATIAIRSLGQQSETRTISGAGFKAFWRPN